MKLATIVMAGALATGAMATPALAQTVYFGFGDGGGYWGAPYGDGYGYGSPYYATPQYGYTQPYLGYDSQPYYSGRSVYRSYRQYRRSSDNPYN